MPGYNGTGPNNAGPMTGRGFGPCGKGMGLGRPCGRAYGFGNQRWNMVGFSKEEEKQVLQDEAKSLTEELSEINKRITEIAK
jgi:hypothetical protein